MSPSNIKAEKREVSRVNGAPAKVNIMADARIQLTGKIKKRYGQDCPPQRVLLPGHALQLTS